MGIVCYHKLRCYRCFSVQLKIIGQRAIFVLLRKLTLSKKKHHFRILGTVMRGINTIHYNIMVRLLSMQSVAFYLFLIAVFSYSTAFAQPDEGAFQALFRADIKGNGKTGKLAAKQTA